MPVVLFLNAPRAMNHAGMATASRITTGLKKVLCNTGSVFGVMWLMKCYCCRGCLCRNHCPIAVKNKLSPIKTNTIPEAFNKALG